MKKQLITASLFNSISNNLHVEYMHHELYQKKYLTLCLAMLTNS